MEAIDKNHGGGVLDEGEVGVAGLGGVKSEIKCGGWFCPVKPKSERACSISLGGETACRERDGDLLGEVDVLIRGVGGWEPHNYEYFP
jgi:hypothetical protein